MKFFVAFALIAAVASAAIIKPTQVSAELAELQEIIAAINSPSTNPATAAALEQMLQDLLGVGPIAIGPAIVDTESSPISVGPAIIEAGDVAVGPAMIDFPLPDGGAVSAPVDVSPVDASPVVIGPMPAGSSPALVQIIVNVNGAAAGAVVDPVQVADQVVDPVHIVDEVVEPVQIVDSPTIIEPVQVVDVMPVVDPVQVVDVMPVVDPVQVVDVMPVVVPGPIIEVMPVVVEPVQIGAPIIPSPAVSLPEELN